MNAEFVVAVPKLPREQGEARRDHQRAKTVRRPAHPGHEPGEEERPRGHDGAGRTKLGRRRQVVDLNPVGEDAEHDPREPQRDLDPARARHARIVTLSRPRVHGAHPGRDIGKSPSRVPSAPGYRRDAPLLPSGHDESQLTYRSRWRLGDPRHHAGHRSSRLRDRAARRDRSGRSGRMDRLLHVRSVRLSRFTEPRARSTPSPLSHRPHRRPARRR